MIKIYDVRKHIFEKTNTAIGIKINTIKQQITGFRYYSLAALPGTS